MREIIKKIAITLPGVALLTNIAFADNFVNDDTGRNSNNEIAVEEENEVEVETNNDADIFNRLDVHANTGHNQANNNDGDDHEWWLENDNEEDEDGANLVDVSTGDARAAVDVNNRANWTEVDVAMPASNGDVDAVNSDTGRNSNNQIEIEKENKVEVQTNNDADVWNCIDVHANTGHNRANNNEGDVSISTGNASASVNLTNNVNTTSVTVR